jgi:hypothetical protein
LVFSLVLLAVGGLAVAQLLGAKIPVSGYFATALTLVGAGLVVGAFAGRSRRLIFLGLILTIGLLVSTGVERAGLHNGEVQNVTVRPVTLADLKTQYDHNVGRVVLDLRELDFTDQSLETRLDVGAGNVEVWLPPAVDATVRADIGVGHAEVLGNESGGTSVHRQVTDNGTDGVGGGNLRLRIDLGIGNVEVKR